MYKLLYFNIKNMIQKFDQFKMLIFEKTYVQSGIGIFEIYQKIFFFQK